MAQVVWSPKAIQDLDDICTYIAQNSEKYARAFAGHVHGVVALIPRAPRKGWMVPEYELDELRERLVHN